MATSRKRIDNLHQATSIINRQRETIELQTSLIARQLSQQNQILSLLRTQAEEVARLNIKIEHIVTCSEAGFSTGQLVMTNPRFRRNELPNDHSAIQKQLIATWQQGTAVKIGYQELLESGFRVFSQNDEDGVLLRIFSHIGQTNKYVIEIGSNCSDSDVGIPENLSTNLIVNHGWHGAIFEMDNTECDRMRYFFARDFSTKHFHVTTPKHDGYFSPLITPKAITPENIDATLREASTEREPDLMVIDIDGGDYAVVKAMTAIQPRVMVVELEKRFRDRFSVVQSDRNDFSKNWPQSGATSLLAWINLLGDRGYSLCALGGCGFNAFFVRSDIAAARFQSLEIKASFDMHPILSKVSENFWLEPDETWQVV